MKNTLVVFSLISTIFINSATVLPVSASGENNVELEIGDYLEMGTYNQEHILWRCVDIDEKGPLMLSDKIITLKSSDANGDVDTGSHRWLYRKKYGSNFWRDSNIRSWLNSNETAGNVTWLCGNPPDMNHTNSGYNAYENESGFLTNFSNFELNHIKSVTQDSILDTGDYSNLYSYGTNYHLFDSSISSVIQNAKTSAYREQVTDKVFLLDVNQINKVWQNDYLLGGNNYYIGYPTQKAVDYSGYKSKKLDPEKPWTTWLRTPKSNSDGRNVRYVSSDGLVLYALAYMANIGIRPAFYLTSAAFEAEGAGTLEKPYSLSEIIVESSKDENTYRFEASVSPFINFDNALLVFAGYKENNLLFVETKNLTPSSRKAIFDISNQEVDTFKFMLLDDINTLTPLINSYNILASNIQPDEEYYSPFSIEDDSPVFYLNDENNNISDRCCINYNELKDWE